MCKGRSRCVGTLCIHRHSGNLPRATIKARKNLYCVGVALLTDPRQSQRDEGRKDKKQRMREGRKERERRWVEGNTRNREGGKKERMREGRKERERQWVEGS